MISKNKQKNEDMDLEFFFPLFEWFHSINHTNDVFIQGLLT